MASRTQILSSEKALERRAAHLEADQANRDFMDAWLNDNHSLEDPFIQALRAYRGTCERLTTEALDAQIAAIAPPEPEDFYYGHIDYPHWPGTLWGCNACECAMQAAYEAEYDTREYRE